MKDAGQDRAGDRQRFREQTIRRIDRRWGSDAEAESGIFGGVVCQACGEFGTFMGIAGAIGTHQSGPFVHPGCRAREAQVRKRQTRFCEICRQVVDREAAGQRFDGSTYAPPACRRSRPRRPAGTRESCFGDWGSGATGGYSDGQLPSGKASTGPDGQDNRLGPGAVGQGSEVVEPKPVPRLGRLASSNLALIQSESGSFSAWRPQRGSSSR